MTAADEPEENASPGALHETTATPTGPDTKPSQPVDTVTQPLEENTTTANTPTFPEPPSQQTQQAEQIDTDTDPSPSNTTSAATTSIPTPAAPPAEEIPSTTAFVSPSPALPPLSRSTSSASPFRRPRSRTPSSTRTSSRALSQVFDRLRDISRSSTRSKRDKGSRSRPASLVLGNPDLLEDSNEDAALRKTNTTDFALGDFSDVAVMATRPEATRSTSSFSVMGIRSTERRVDSWEEPRPPSSSTRGITRVMSMASPTRTEAWNEPDAQLPPPKTPEERTGTPRRLGILPSPAPTAATFEEGRRASGEVARRRSSAAAWRPVTQDGDGEGPELATVPSEGEMSRLGKEEQEDVVKEEEERPAPIRKSSDLAILPSQRTGDGEGPTSGEEISTSPTFVPPSPSRPPPQRPRKLSDLQLLPSQRRLSPLNIARSDSMTLTTLNFSSNESVDAEAEVHEASPVTIKEMSPAVVVSGKKVGEEDGEERTPIVAKRRDEDLYERTPVATKMKEEDWGKEDRKVSASTTADFEDARSEVSAEDGAQQESSHHSTNPTTSRHSSVSSLGAGARRATAEEAVDEQPVMSAQAVPAGPTGASPHTTPERAHPHAGVLQELTAAAARRHEQPQQLQLQDAGEYQQRFASRQYTEQRPGMGERPMSYMPLPRDDQGLPVQETISTGTGEALQSPRPPPSQPAMPVDLSNMAGPPPGAPPFSQHPAVRNSGSVQPTQYERLRSSVISTGSGHTPQSSIDTGGRPPSGFFRGRPEQAAGAPPPSRISDQHGLEGLHAYGQVGADAVQRPPQQDDGKQARRRSGLWESLTSRRSSAQRFDSSRESSVAPLEAPVMSAAPAAAAASAEVPTTSEESKRKTLKKPQRASSSVADAEPKKKRFSKLGSLFGRSSTTGGNVTTKPNRLTKNAPPTRENSIAQAPKPPSQQQPPQNSSTVVGSVRGYEAYEAMRRRDMPAFQENAANVQGSPPAQLPSLPAGESVEPPLGGWYGPQSEQQQERPMSPTDAPRPEFRRLHSESRRGGSERGGLAQVPEAFRPVQASFNRPVEPIGPPAGQEPPVMRMSGRGGPPGRQPSYPGQTPSAAMERMMDPYQQPQQYAPQPPPQHQRYPSYGSDTTPPPVSARSEYYAPGSRPYGSLPSISPVQSRTGYERVNSIPEETTARSPAREYADQQTPWAITLPQGGSSGPSSRASSWAMGMGSPQQEFVPPPPPPQYRPPPPPPPQQGQGLVLTAPANVGFYPPPPRGVPPPRPFTIPWEEDQPIRQGPYPPFHQPYNHPPQQQSPPRGSVGPPRFYARQNSGEYPYPPSRQFESGEYSYPPRPVVHQRRPSSGYSGRRDEPAVGEEELVMRGASYPGQEWTPSGLGRGGWE
ncbi:hypothetical protein M409DRAFT_29350 [Zasmidium cellare ATCC 36951]|uniref:Uncharacterized protein n=1 Tax=Zasmidium cellare ATCC 36951 TaxID=1080233 RepID=A0A6A6BZQ4_ZASCE|nr:uncharacterized protein M409DRAFT_29350 [Zasmidium cellare ATCC 36951]KAF2160261.1 hypothetical protein M409DRAFT_29350 [Zasmidium cellare ATCC 36951]